MNRRNTATLPEELVISEILPKVPAKSLIRFKCVSKDWLEVITNGAPLKKAHARHHTARTSPEISFIIHGLERYSIGYHKLFFISRDDREIQNNISPLEVEVFDMSYLRSVLEPPEFNQFNSIQVVGSSNGIVLLNKPLTWWNPITREFRFLPEAPRSNQERISFESLILNVGFDDESGDHKVVQVSNTWKSDADNVAVPALNFQVFSKKADSWNDLKTVPGFTIYTANCSPVSIDGTSHFLARQRKPNMGSAKLVILSFTYRNLEVRHVIDAPNYRSVDGREPLLVLKLVRWKVDSLALMVTDLVSTNVNDLWGMIKNDDTGNGFRWSKLFVFEFRPYICGFWSDRFLIIRKPSDELVLWDPQTDADGDSCLKLVELHEHIWGFGIVNDYVPTLVSVFPDP